MHIMFMCLFIVISAELLVVGLVGGVVGGGLAGLDERGELLLVLATMIAALFILTIMLIIITRIMTTTCIELYCIM